MFDKLWNPPDQLTTGWSKTISFGRNTVRYWSVQILPAELHGDA